MIFTPKYPPFTLKIFEIEKKVKFHDYRINMVKQCQKKIKN